jgi:guanine deaminase
MMDAIKSAILASKVLLIHAQQKQLDEPGMPSRSLPIPLTVGEAFFLATLGSAQICALDDRIGNFEAGKDFDAVVVDLKQLHEIIELDREEIQSNHHQDALKHYHKHLANNIDLWHHDDLLTAFERFIYLGDDRNIAQVWVRGRLIKGVESMH